MKGAPHTSPPINRSRNISIKFIDIEERDKMNEQLQKKLGDLIRSTQDAISNRKLAEKQKSLIFQLKKKVEQLLAKKSDLELELKRVYNLFDVKEASHFDDLKSQSKRLLQLVSTVDAIAKTFNVSPDDEQSILRASTRINNSYNELQQLMNGSNEYMPSYFKKVLHQKAEFEKLLEEIAVACDLDKSQISSIPIMQAITNFKATIKNLASKLKRQELKVQELVTQTESGVNQLVAEKDVFVDRENDLVQIVNAPNPESLHETIREIMNERTELKRRNNQLSHVLGCPVECILQHATDMVQALQKQEVVEREINLTLGASTNNTVANVKSLLKETNTLRDNLNEVNNKLDSKHQEVCKANVTINRLKQQILNLEKENKQLLDDNRNYQETIITKVSEIENQVQTVASKDSILHKLTTENKFFQEEMNKMKSDLKQMHDQVVFQQGIIEQKENEISQLASHISQGSGTMQMKDQVIAEKRSEIANLNSQVRNLNHKLHEKGVESEENSSTHIPKDDGSLVYQNQIENKEKLLKEMEINNKMLRDELLSVRQDYQNYKNETTQTIAMLSQKLAEANEASNKLNLEYKPHMISLETAVRSKDSEVSKLTAEISSLTATNRAALKQIDDLMKDLDDERVKFRDAQQSEIEATNALNREKKLVADLTEKIEIMESSISSISKENQDNVERISVLNRQDFALNDQLSRLQREKKLLTEGQVELENQIASLNHEVETNMTAIASLQTSEARLREQIAKEQKEIQVLREKNRYLTEIREEADKEVACFSQGVSNLALSESKYKEMYESEVRENQFLRQTLKKLEDSLVRSDRSVDNQAITITGIPKDVLQTDETIQMHTNDKQVLEDELNKIKLDYKQQGERLEAALKELSDSKTSLHRAEGALESEKESKLVLLEEVKRLNEARYATPISSEEYTVRVNEFAGREAKLLEELKYLKNELERVSNDNNILREQAKSLESQTSDKAYALNSQEQSSFILHDADGQQRLQVSASTQKERKLMEQLSDKQRNNIELERHIENLNAKINESQAEASHLREELVLSQQRLSWTNNQLSEMEKKCNSLSTQLNDKNDSFKAFRNSICSSTNMSTSLKDEDICSSISKVFKGFKKINSELCSVLSLPQNALSKDIKIALREMKQQNDIIKDLESQLPNELLDSQSSNDHAARLKTKVNSLQNKVDRNQEFITAMSRNLGTDSEIKAIQQRLEQIHIKGKNLEDETDNIQQLLTKLSKELSCKTDEVDIAVHELIVQNTDLLRLKKNIELLLGVTSHLDDDSTLLETLKALKETETGLRILLKSDDIMKSVQLIVSEIDQLRTILGTTSIVDSVRDQRKLVQTMEDQVQKMASDKACITKALGVDTLHEAHEKIINIQRENQNMQKLHDFQEQLCKQITSLTNDGDNVDRVTVSEVVNRVTKLVNENSLLKSENVDLVNQLAKSLGVSSGDPQQISKVVANIQESLQNAENKRQNLTETLMRVCDILDIPYHENSQTTYKLEKRVRELTETNQTLLDSIGDILLVPVNKRTPHMIIEAVDNISKKASAADRIMKQIDTLEGIHQKIFQNLHKRKHENGIQTDPLLNPAFEMQAKRMRDVDDKLRSASEDLARVNATNEVNIRNLKDIYSSIGPYVHSVTEAINEIARLKANNYELNRRVGNTQKVPVLHSTISAMHVAGIARLRAESERLSDTARSISIDIRTRPNAQVNGRYRPRSVQI